LLPQTRALASIVEIVLPQASPRLPEHWPRTTDAPNHSSLVPCCNAPRTRLLDREHFDIQSNIVRLAG
jgi:hypothetical protein